MSKKSNLPEVTEDLSQINSVIPEDLIPEKQDTSGGDTYGAAQIDKLEGRITVGLVTPYPPGIPLLIPGEVFNKKIVDYLKFSREFNTRCPGFETDVHGLVEEVDADGKTHYFADCVRE